MELNTLTTNTDTTIKNALNDMNSARNMKRINETSKEFEAVFVSEMMKPMFEGLETDGLFGGGQAEKVFRSIMLQEYGKVMADTGRVGIADHVKQSLIQTQALNEMQKSKVTA